MQVNMTESNDALTTVNPWWHDEVLATIMAADALVSEHQVMCICNTH